MKHPQRAEVKRRAAEDERYDSDKRILTRLLHHMTHGTKCSKITRAPERDGSPCQIS
jgi:hypothetical protein